MKTIENGKNENIGVDFCAYYDKLLVYENDFRREEHDWQPSKILRVRHRYP